jgi:CDP-4-dehydro-6-deoxyglucose reductase/ferredoxin-NAD(P)+ reductase (naphthalene dioxygenase ferredoxin-specific)
MKVTLRIRDIDAPIEAEMGTTVLAAALAADVPFKHSCQSGNCGACKCELIDGDIMVMPHSEYALTPEDAEDGFILACRSSMWGDTEVAFLNDLAIHPMRDLICTVTSHEKVTHDVAVIRAKIGEGGPYTFEPGQFARVTMPNGASRDYSMASQSGEDVLEFQIRRIEGGFASTYAFDSLSVDDELEIHGPFGSAWWRPSHEGTLLAIAGSTGLAPMQSIIETALKSQSPQTIHLYLGVREERDLYHLERMTALSDAHNNFSFVPVLSDVASHASYRTGFVTDAIRNDFESLEGAHVYMAGPPAMVEASVALAKSIGADGRNCHADVFFTAEAAA